MNMRTDEAIDALARAEGTSEALEMGADALAFVQALHEMFRSTGMTTKSAPDLNELENLVDALHGELAAACIFLSQESFARVPDMLRVISKQLEHPKGSALPAQDVPVVVAKGYARLAKRIENTRVQMQNLAPTKESA